MFFQFDASCHAVVILLVLGTILFWPIARASLLKLQKQGARIVLLSCGCHLAHLTPDLYSRGGCARIICLGQLVSSCHRLKLLLNRDCAVQKKKSCEVVGIHQSSECNPVLCCVWETLFSWLLIWHLIGSSIFFEFGASRHAVVNLLVLGTILVLPLAIVPLLKLYWQSATTILPSCACNSAHLRPDLYSTCGCAKIMAHLSSSKPATIQW